MAYTRRNSYKVVGSMLTGLLTCCRYSANVSSPSSFPRQDRGHLGDFVTPRISDGFVNWKIVLIIAWVFIYEHDAWRLFFPSLPVCRKNIPKLRWSWSLGPIGSDPTDGGTWAPTHALGDSQLTTILSCSLAYVFHPTDLLWKSLSPCEDRHPLFHVYQTCE